MKTIKTLFLLLLVTFNFSLMAQDLEITVHDTLLQGALGDDIAFEFEAVNISSEIQTVFLVRTINDLPDTNWTSALCFGIQCFAYWIDSVATSGGANPPLNPGDTLKASVHVNPLSVDGTANVQAQVGTFRNPNDRFTMNFTATTLPSSVEEDESNPSDYFLLQNYPNPFNPSTQINYNVGEGGLVNLKVYNILGMEVATLVSEYKPAGSYQVSFDGKGLSSGVYIYNLSVNNFTKTRKMILEK